MARCLRYLALFVCLFAAKGLLATTYYVDYANGNDSWDGKSKDHSAGGAHGPWKNAPGMCNGSCGPSTKIAPGDSIIFKGCVVWPNASFSWHPPFAGSAGNPVYVGIDQTWWDSSAPGCSSAWNRPIFDTGGTMFADGTTNGKPWQQMIWSHDFITYDGFEIRNFLCAGNIASSQMVVFASFQEAMNVTIRNMYIHGWKTDYTRTTGTIASGSNILTVADASKLYVGEPVGVYFDSNLSAVLPKGGNGTHITGISGNAVTLDHAATVSNCATNQCVVWASDDSCNFVYMNVNDGDNNSFEESIIDGSDSDIIALDPNCTGECLASGGRALYATPSRVKNNVIRYTSNGPIFSHCREVSGNLIENIRLSVNPYAHTNGIECNSDSMSGALIYNNILRNMNVNNASGQRSVGVLLWEAPQAGATNPSYVFNNIFYNTIQNGIAIAAALGTSGGSTYYFNNTESCGPDWNIGYSCFNVTADCGPGKQTCYFSNNQLITNNDSAWGGNCAPPNCNADSSNLIQTPSAASAAGYSSSSSFAFIPGSATAPTVKKGTNLSTLWCVTVASMSVDAGTACLADTSYGPSYNPVTHWITPPPPGGRPPSLRPNAGNWDIGPYLFGGSSSKPVTPPGLATAPH